MIKETVYKVPLNCKNTFVIKPKMGPIKGEKKKRDSRGFNDSSRGKKENGNTESLCCVPKGEI